MPAEWPLTVKLHPTLRGLDSLVIPAPKYRTINELSRDVKNQQSELVDDVLYVLNGGEGNYIKFVETFDPAVLDDKLVGPRYKLPLSLDPSLRDVLIHITEVAGSAYSVKTFADHYSGIEYGRVNQALASAYRVLFSLYLSHLTQIETSADDKKTLYSIWVRLEPFASHLNNARLLIARLMDETRLARERKRRHGALNLVERASTAQFVAHDEKEAVIELRGGAVLRTIAELMRLEMGDSEASNLYEELISAASKPYLNMIQTWINKGELDDPFEEFLIQETQAFNLEATRENVDDYWDKRYTVRAMVLPLQLSSLHMYNMLLVSGKYLNVIRETKNDIGDNQSTSNLDECRSVEDPRVLEAIAQAYKHANLTLKSVLTRPPVFNMKNLLLSLQQTFFLFNSDLYDTFAINAKVELQKPIHSVSITKLEHALALAKDPEDPWSKYVGISLSNESLRDALLSVVESYNSSESAGGSKVASSDQQQLSEKMVARNAVQFTFGVPFPLNVVVSPRSIIRYQWLFRYIVELKSTHALLSHAWLTQAKDSRWKVPLSYNEDVGDAVLCIRRMNLLRQRLLHFATVMLYHATVDGIQYEFSKLMENLNSYEEVAELAENHNQFLHKTLMKCLLSDPSLLKTQFRLLTLCRQYANFLELNSDAASYIIKTDLENMMVDENGNDLHPHEIVAWFTKAIDRYENSFNRNIQKFNDELDNFMPDNFVAGASTAYLKKRLEPLFVR